MIGREQKETGYRVQGAEMGSGCAHSFLHSRELLIMQIFMKGDMNLLHPFQ